MISSVDFTNNSMTGDDKFTKRGDTGQYLDHASGLIFFGTLLLRLCRLDCHRFLICFAAVLAICSGEGVFIEKTQVAVRASVAADRRGMMPL